MYGCVCVCVLVRVAAMKPQDQKQVGEERFIWLTLPHHLSLKETRTGTQRADRYLEAGCDAEAMKGCCLLACSPWLAKPAFL